MKELLDRLVDQMVPEASLRGRRHEFEQRFIARMLADTDGNLSKTASRLGIHRNTLTRKMAELGIKPGKSSRHR